MSLAQVAYDRYAGKMKEGSFMVYDSDEVKTLLESCKASQYGFPFTKIARELGYVGAANLVAAGVIVKLTGVLTKECMEQAITEKYGSKPKALDINMAAFRTGYDLV